MALAPANFPRDLRATAYRKVVDVLSRKLASRAVNVVAWDDGDSGNPPPANTRWIRLTPFTSPIGMAGQYGFGRRLVESPIRVVVETYVPSLLWDDSMDLIGAIEHALRPESDREAFDAELEAAGISDLEWTKPIETSQDVDGFLHGVGEMRLLIWILH